MAARIGGDEFIVLLNYLNEDFDTAKEESRSKALLIQQSLFEDIKYKHKKFNVGASFGVRMICGRQLKNKGVEAVIREADVSMYHAKQSGKGKVVLFDDTERSE